MYVYREREGRVGGGRSVFQDTMITWVLGKQKKVGRECIDIYICRERVCAGGLTDGKQRHRKAK